MRSAPLPTPDDLTARARIRDAAIDRFGRDGFGVSLRTIAQDAGVSAPLVLHHFGSKDRLRAECDVHVLATIAAHKQDVVSTGGADHLLVELAQVETYAPLVGYVLRSLQHGGELARTFFEAVVADAEQYLRAGVAAGTVRPSRDEPARARFLAQQAYGGLLVALTLEPVDDPALLGPRLRAHLDAVALPSLELYTEGLLADRTMLDTYLAYAADPSRAAADAPAQPA
ncbi:TetR/AcrR family transcriptional regulator [Cellulomonas shaoxiangyii]|uniref:TetR/AcrR family transcriptional regulator n=1 Tax=Cellulomonas shaoxiangyii TaxID=2566013 RepID=A0A4P7SPF7_9CELL|nr:TetR family transcriptional regulator [Cellulomonas shaoxiangyii]QCB94874.1 TetR/AcrR family transcriptional regulator [Cellulomonas shaoxiangyii]TGY85103.1 TetR/AcrR family transcriptional regulator [Cellulomonas shaoxiangyii]